MFQTDQQRVIGDSNPNLTSTKSAVVSAQECRLPRNLEMRIALYGFKTHNQAHGLISIVFHTFEGLPVA